MPGIPGEPRTACFLEELIEGSRQYAKEVGDRLKKRVFEDIFPIIADGFISDIKHRDGAAQPDQEQLDLVYKATLTLLYRLLFLLYAESRDLLPVAEVVLPYAEAETKKGVTIKRQGRGKDAPEEVILPGEVYLENSRHERKASGSYYTPEYIVKYIVEHTVGPVLDEKLQALRDDLNRACADYRKFRRQKQGEGLEPHDGLIKNSDLEHRVIRQCFDLSVLDPAMGSGHFLVTAVDFIADRLIHFLNGFLHNPVERMLNDTRRAITEQAHREGIVIDESKLTHINLLKRHVLKRCIYGVALNPMTRFVERRFRQFMVQYNERPDVKKLADEGEDRHEISPAAEPPTFELRGCTGGDDGNRRWRGGAETPAGHWLFVVSAIRGGRRAA